MSETKDVNIKILTQNEIVLDKEKGIKVIQGPPTQLDQQGIYNPPGTEMLIIPNSPHVFKVDELTVRDSNHLNEQLSDVNVLMAHGIKTGNSWRFIDGGDVVETVNAYNIYAGQNGLKPIEFLVVCSKAQPHPMGIRGRILLIQ